MVSSYGNNMDMELQQRAVEYCAIFSKHDNMRCAHFILECLFSTHHLSSEGNACIVRCLANSVFLVQAMYSMYMLAVVFVCVSCKRWCRGVCRAALLERMPALSRDSASSSAAAANGEPSETPAPTSNATATTPQLSLEVNVYTVLHS